MKTLVRPRIRLSPMSTPTARLWVCGVIGPGRTPLDAYNSWKAQVELRPDLMRSANGR